MATAKKWLLSALVSPFSMVSSVKIKTMEVEDFEIQIVPECWC
jgi:hypothetical protein